MNGLHWEGVVIELQIEDRIHKDPSPDGREYAPSLPPWYTCHQAAEVVTHTHPNPLVFVVICQQSPPLLALFLRPQTVGTDQITTSIDSSFITEATSEDSPYYRGCCSTVRGCLVRLCISSVVHVVVGVLPRIHATTTTGGVCGGGGGGGRGRTRRRVVLVLVLEAQSAHQSQCSHDMFDWWAPRPRSIRCAISAQQRRCLGERRV